MGEEEELYFGWGRRPWRRDKIVSGGKERFLIGMGEETGGWEKSEGKKKKKDSEGDMWIWCKEIY